MYVRTKKGEIFECYESEQMHKPIYYPKKSKTNGYIDYEDVYKKSNNIIDILEVGDYVNGHKVFQKEEYQIRVEDRENTWGVAILDETDIKTIVTRELFSAMEYKVESEVK